MHYRVGRCTNHSESLHCIFNSLLNKCRYFISRLIQAKKMIIKRYHNSSTRNGRSIKDAFSKLKWQTHNIKNNDSDSSCNLKNCDCGWNEYYSQIFGTKFPCVHEIKHSDFD